MVGWCLVDTESHYAIKDGEIDAEKYLKMPLRGKENEKT